MLSNVNGQRVLDKLADLPQRVGEPLQLEGNHGCHGFKQKALTGIGPSLAVLTKVFVGALELVDREEAGEALLERVRALALLPLSGCSTMLKS